ncbi:MAG: FtsX-like permease family protein [Candidatus Hodarchaeales archaeon]
MLLRPSVIYALRSIRRSFRRSFTLMFGVIISLAIVSGVLFYLDSTSGTLVGTALSDIQIDIAINDKIANETEMKTLQEFCRTSVSDSIVTAELIAGSEPVGPNTVGAIVATDNQYNISSGDLRQILVSGGGNFTVTYIFGVDPSYFDEFSIFSTSENVTQIFAEDEVLISSDLATYLTDVDNIVNVSLISVNFDTEQGGPPEVTLNTELSTNLTVGGITAFDTAAMQAANYAFDPDSLEEEQLGLRSSTQLSNCIIMSYSKYMELMNDVPEAISLNAVHLKIDHSQLSSDTSGIYSQLSQITSIIEVYYPNPTVVDLLSLTLDQVADQLNQMRLFLIYFALPGLLLGAYISKYAIDLTIEERQREIGTLRTKAAVRSQIALIIGVESFIIAGLGLVIGILVGYFASLSISNLLNNGTGLIEVTFDSMVISVGIGGIIVFIAAFFSSKQLLTPSVTETMKASKEQRSTLWRRIYLDFILLSIVIVVAIMNLLEFNPIPGFATAIYDFVAPLLTWIGLTLLMVRILERVFQRLEEPITKIYRLIFKDLAHVITKNILYKPQRITKITIVLSLTLSFGLVIATINETYQQGARDDALYQVGADLRIQFPTTDYLDYNTSDLIAAFENDFIEEVAATTAIYSTTFRFGRQQVLVVGIEPDTFFDVGMLEDNFFQSNNYEATRDNLLDDSSGSYDNVIFSIGLASPASSSIAGGRFGGRIGFQEEQQIFSIGDTLPMGENGSEVEVADIVAHFPAVADLTGSSEDDLQFVVCNVELLTNPIPPSNTSYLSDENASHFFVNINDGFEIHEIQNAFIEWYEQNYPNSAEISIVSVEEYYESYSSLITSLTGLTSLEFILVLTVSTLGLEIFLTSSLYERKKEFGTYYAIGGPVNDVRKLILGELSLITGFSLLTGVFLSGLVSLMYLGFISDLLILEVYSVIIPLESILGLVCLVIIAMVISIILAGRKLSRLDPVNILRAV